MFLSERESQRSSIDKRSSSCSTVLFPPQNGSPTHHAYRFLCGSTPPPPSNPPVVQCARLHWIEKWRLGLGCPRKKERKKIPITFSSCSSKLPPKWFLLLLLLSSSFPLCIVSPALAPKEKGGHPPSPHWRTSLHERHIKSQQAGTDRINSIQARG